METVEQQARMWTDLFTSEMRAQGEQHAVTERATIYLSAGLPLDQVLDALKISRATWYRRAQDHQDWQAANRAAIRSLDTAETS